MHVDLASFLKKHKKLPSLINKGREFTRVATLVDAIMLHPLFTVNACKTFILTYQHKASGVSFVEPSSENALSLWHFLSYLCGTPLLFPSSVLLFVYYGMTIILIATWRIVKHDSVFSSAFSLHLRKFRIRELFPYD